MPAPEPIRIGFGRLCRDTRLMLDIAQAELARAVGMSLPLGHPPVVFNSPRQRDLVHACCSGYVDRRLTGLGWTTRREVTIARGRMRGWIDLLAYDPRRRILLIIEIKTWLDDLGATERQLDWYQREATAVAPKLGFRPIRTIGWLLILATSEVEDALRRNRDAVDRRFPARAHAMRGLISGTTVPTADGLALDRSAAKASRMADPGPDRWSTGEGPVR